MTNVQGESQRGSVKNDFDAVIIGAGFSGMYMLHSLRDKLDLNVTVFEAGDGVGGTWYWNRYPGARCDSDSYIYCYTFDKNLLQEWNWSERYPEQDEILRYLEHCAERFDLKPDIQFGKRVVEVVFDDNTELWTVRTAKATSYRRASSLPRSALCRPPTCRRSRNLVLSRASATTPASGRMTASISPPSVSVSSAQVPPRCRRSRRSRSRPST
jgi:cyclohexanone monooxygenase